MLEAITTTPLVLVAPPIVALLDEVMSVATITVALLTTTKINLKRENISNPKVISFIKFFLVYIFSN